MTNRPFKTGESREQASLLPPRIEDYVGPDNPVRAIESYVCALDLAKLGFRHADRTAEETGQPPYDPADLLKLYLYGYINQVRSSRRLEREASRNLELIWLLEEPEAGLSDDRQLPQGELGGVEGCEPQLRAAGSRAWACRRQPLLRSTARSSMAMPARRASLRARGLPNRSQSWTWRSRLTASLLRTMMRRKPRSQTRIALTVRAMAAEETAAISAPKSRR